MANQFLWNASVGSDGDPQDSTSWNNLDSASNDVPGDGDDFLFDPSRGGSNVSMTVNADFTLYSPVANYIFADPSYTGTIMSEGEPWKILWTKLHWQSGGEGSLNIKCESDAGSGVSVDTIIESASAGTHFIDSNGSGLDVLTNLSFLRGKSTLGNARGGVEVAVVGGTVNETTVEMTKSTLGSLIDQIVQAGGTCNSSAIVTNLDLSAESIYNQIGTTAIAKVTQSSGILNQNSSGTVTNVFMSGGVFNLLGNSVKKIITNFYRGKRNLDVRYNTQLHTINFIDTFGTQQI